MRISVRWLLRLRPAPPLDWYETRFVKALYARDADQRIGEALDQMAAEHGP